MFGIGYQELLVLVVLFALYLLVLPAVTYLLASLFLRILKSPRRALLAFWLLAIVVAALMYHADGDLGAFIVAVILAPLGIAINVGCLWLMGGMWRGVGLSRMGTAWRNTATLLFRAARPVAAK
jgi:hypothetical protein